jgi:hypothetical protein
MSLVNPLTGNAPQCALLIIFFDKRQTILLVNGEALELNGLRQYHLSVTPPGGSDKLPLLLSSMSSSNTDASEKSLKLSRHAFYKFTACHKYILNCSVFIL